MAEAFVKAMLDNLNSLIQKEFGLLWGFDKEMEKLSSTLSTISAVLEDAEEKQFRDRPIKNWLRKLRDASYELDDILDECATEASRMEYEGQRSGSTQKVLASNSLSCFNLMNTFCRHKIAKKLNKIKDRLDEIANERVKFHLQEVVVDRRTRIREMRQTSSIITQPQVYGREEDKERIVEFLVESACGSKNVSIYPIVGLGGIGKTTLAQLVFNDERVINHFELKLWVCVSEEFDVKRMIKAIIESVSRSACDSLDMDPLQKNLQDKLRNRRFLIVLDDVWNEKEEEWDRLKYVLDCGSNGSSIVVTTRLKKVASIMGTTSMHYLSGLSEDHCWLLFKQRAFGDDESEEQTNLVKIGKGIVRKCGGVPLAAKTLGSLMRFKREESQWLSVMKSEIWNLPQDENSILPALRLSYLHLPIELRRCFAFCALFPKDFEIHKQTLIRLWMANGLISSEGRIEVEEIGSEICNELYWRSFFMNYRDDESGKPTDSFIMHDLVHDLAKSIMEDASMDGGSPVKSSSRRVRHMLCTYFARPFDNISNAQSTLRTFMTAHQLGVSNEKWPKFSYDLNDFPSLRAFSIEKCQFSPSISSILSYHKHLRYLNLSGTDIRILPTAICSLPNLQTLDLAHCHKLQKLPKHISRLTSLRHLDIYHCCSLSHTPPNIGRLTCLKTLSTFIVDEKRGHHLDELQGLNLGGDLQIQDLQKVRTSMDAKRTNLISKKDLDSLSLCWGENDPQSPQKAEHVLEALEPPPNLSYLLIQSYEGFCFPRWFDIGILENIVNLTLARCKNISLLPPSLRKLPSLKSLEISGMISVRYLDHESYDGTSMRSFMSLRSLTMKALPNLEKLSREEGREMFPCLTSLNIEKCPKLTLPSLPSIKNLYIGECNEVLLKSIPNFSALTWLSF
ncbi:putative disease resistance protein RGA3 [Ziziphus jujuba]|uniref:Disease resistance protein RGA3 n=3 Tax=Ziziphus jujuba TaxID=326968 RepID=A0A6P3YU21_ZIZJJ|nr:putative disease resistance protein RGA3 [Ziziphus jujuba]XP_015865628.3 putative disease resistance protein RGA3 [Ziziphus jujuba]